MLTGKHVALGPVVPEDFGPLFCWINDIEAARLDAAYRPVDLVAHQQWCQALGTDPTRVFFAIRKVHQTEIIGYVHIWNINGVHRSAELGIRIGSKLNRGLGYGREALGLALDFCWNHANLNRLQLTVFKHNARALKVYAASGFRREGLLRRAAFIDGQWTDIVVMGVLRPGAQPSRKSRSGRQSARPAASAESAPVAPIMADGPDGRSAPTLCVAEDGDRNP